MQGVRRCLPSLPNGGLRLELTPPATTTVTSKSPLTIDVAESTESKIERLISENPVIIFSRPSCCMCHVMKKLLLTIGVHPTVIELEEGEMAALAAHGDGGASGGAPAVFIGGTLVGGLDRLMALHLSEHLVPMLTEAGAFGFDSLS